MTDHDSNIVPDRKIAPDTVVVPNRNVVPGGKDAPDSKVVPCRRAGCDGHLDSRGEFCFECGHTALADGPGTPAINEGMVSADLCPNCGATHMVDQGGGFPQCESCGYTERH